MAETLDAFNAAPPDAAERDVLACCASTRFADAIAGGRPYRGPAALQAAMDDSFAALSWGDIVEGMNAHPRIGERSAAGSPSAAEQSGAATASQEVRQGLAEGNLAYEKRFGHAFLIWSIKAQNRSVSPNRRIARRTLPLACWKDRSK